MVFREGSKRYIGGVTLVEIDPYTAAEALELSGRLQGGPREGSVDAKGQAPRQPNGKALDRLAYLLGIPSPGEVTGGRLAEVIEGVTAARQDVEGVADAIEGGNNFGEFGGESSAGRRIFRLIKEGLDLVRKRIAFPERTLLETTKERLGDLLDKLRGVSLKADQVKTSLEADYRRRVLEAVDNIVMKPRQLREVVINPEWRKLLKEVDLDTFMRFWRHFIPYSSVAVHVTRQGFRGDLRTFGMFHVAGVGSFFNTAERIVQEGCLISPMVAKFGSSDPEIAASKLLEEVRETRGGSVEDYVKWLFETLVNREGLESVWDHSAVHFNIEEPRRVCGLLQYGGEPGLDIAFVAPTALLAALPSSPLIDDPRGAWFLLDPASRYDIRQNPMPPTDREKTDFAVFGLFEGSEGAQLGEIPLWLGFMAVPGNAIVHKDYGTQYKIVVGGDGEIKRVNNQRLRNFILGLISSEGPQEEELEAVRTAMLEFLATDSGDRRFSDKLVKLLNAFKKHTSELRIPDWFVDTSEGIPGSPFVAFLGNLHNQIFYLREDGTGRDVGTDDDKIQEIVDGLIERHGLGYEFLRRGDSQAIFSQEYFKDKARDSQMPLRFFFYDVGEGLNRSLRNLFEVYGITNRWERTKDFVANDYGYPSPFVLPYHVRGWWLAFVDSYLEKLGRIFPNESQYLEDVKSGLRGQLQYLRLCQRLELPSNRDI